MRYEVVPVKEKKISTCGRGYSLPRYRDFSNQLDGSDSECRTSVQHSLDLKGADFFVLLFCFGH